MKSAAGGGRLAEALERKDGEGLAELVGAVLLRLVGEAAVRLEPVLQGLDQVVPAEGLRVTVLGRGDEGQFGGVAGQDVPGRAAGDEGVGVLGEPVRRALGGLAAGAGGREAQHEVGGQPVVGGVLAVGEPGGGPGGGRPGGGLEHLGACGAGAAAAVPAGSRSAAPSSAAGTAATALGPMGSDIRVSPWAFSGPGRGCG
ncbi:hypothetical protein GCM10020000_11080 [Streptomyces olivoverticillatus]